MIGLFFEVLPNDGHADAYFEMAAALRPALDANDGIAFIDRYKSLKRDGVVLSYQHWLTEDDLIRWRENTQHLGAQKLGRDVHFADYRIRVAQLIEDAATLEDAGERILVVAEGTEHPTSPTDGETFKSVYRDNAFVTLLEATGAQHAGVLHESMVDTPGLTAIRFFSVIRDYTMHQRDEAPQAW